jgi:hypothetical protein
VVRVLHVVPLGDAAEHEADDDCVCGPTLKPIAGSDGSLVWIMIHYSLDGRETTEDDH